MSQKRPARKASSAKSTKSRAAKASAKKKPAAKTKAASKKKAATKTKAASKKKAATKTKAASKKKPATKTKAASKKKPTAKTKAASKKKPAAKTKAASKKKAATKTKAASKKKAASKTKAASKKKAASKTKAASKKKPAAKTKAASKKKPAAKTKAASKTKAVAKKKPTAAVSAPSPKPAEAGSAPEVGSADQENSNVTPKTASSRVIRRRPAPAPASGDTPAPDSTSAPRPGVIRVAAGERTPNRGKRRTGKPVVELNPKLESSRHTLPKAQGQVPGGRPQSFAERVRAEAEAAFQRIAPKWKTEDAPPPPEEAPAPSNPALHRSSFEIRISEQDALTTKLRATVGRTALEAAQELARRFRLPPDQGLLLKVIELRDTELTRLALEELLELDDRGRVRSNPELIGTLKGIKSRDKEIKELRGLILEKLGAK